MEWDIGVCGIAVLDHFSSGISGILIQNCGIADLRDAVVFSILGGVKNYHLSPATFFELFLPSHCFGNKLK